MQNGCVRTVFSVNSIGSPRYASWTGQPVLLLLQFVNSYLRIFSLRWSLEMFDREPIACRSQVAELGPCHLQHRLRCERRKIRKQSIRRMPDR